MKTLSNALLILLVVCPLAAAQTSHDNYHDKVKATQAARMDALRAQNAYQAQQRYNKAAYTRYKNTMKMREESEMMFGSERTWKSGMKTMSGVLSSITGQKKAVLLESERDKFDARNYFVVKISDLSDDDQEYIKAWQRFKKLKTDEKKFVIKSFYTALENSKIEALRQASAPYLRLVDGFDKIEIGETKDKVSDILGDQVEIIGSRRKTKDGTTETLSWWARHPESKRKVSLRIRFVDGKVESINSVNFSSVQIKQTVTPEEIQALKGFEILFKDHMQADD